MVVVPLKLIQKEFWNGNIPWIQSSDLEINRLFNVSPKKKITNEAVKNLQQKLFLLTQLR